MKKADQKLVISSYKRGLPSLRLLIMLAFFCFFPIVVLAYGLYVAAVTGFPFSGYLIVFFLLCITIIMVIGIWNLIPETVEINDCGIKVKKGGKTKEATWSEVSKVRCKRALWWMGRGIVGIIATATPLPAIVIKTKRWKHTIVSWRYDSDELISPFVSIAEHVMPLGAVIEDEVGWLPERLSPPEKVHLLRIREYIILSEIGSFMILIGIILFAIYYYIVGFILLFIGGLCALCGGLGYFYEK